MATLLARLGTTAYRRWPFFIAAWVVVLAVIIGLAAAFSKPMSDNFTIPGIPSEQAADLQAELFPGATSAFDQANVNVVVQAPEGETLADPRNAAVVEDLIADLEALPQQPADVEILPPGQVAAGQEQQLVDQAKASGGSVEQARADAAALSPLTEDGRTGLVTYTWDVDSPADVEPETLDALDEVMDDARDQGLVVEANGPGATGFATPGLASEALGIGVALLVLILTFGSLVAAGLPIITALIGVGIGLTGVTAMTALVDISSSTSILATMIGLAVGIDYTLFILARYRTELHHTDDRARAVGIAVGTAGSAVVFAGLTVLIALSALSVVGIPFLSAMGLAAAATVFVAVLISLTLLPAVLGLLGRRAFGGQVRRYAPPRDEQGLVVNNGVRWARWVGKRPVALVLAVVVALGALAIPLKELQLAFPTDSTAASDTTQRQASDIIAAEFGPGREAPLLVVVDARDVADGEQGAAFGEVVGWASGLDGVENAQVVATNADPTAEPGTPAATPTGALVQVLPEFGPAEAEAQDLLTDLREGEPGIEDATGTDIGVTGLTAITTDVSDRLADALPVYLTIIVGLAFILLMIVFRSILVPLTATLGFLLSVLATLGATVAVFQLGWGGFVEGQPLVSFIPLFLIGVVFGLAMDYQVFLVTRIREARVHGMSTPEAIVDGFRNSARVVTAAAAIMTAVFSAFVLQDDAIIKSMGFALAIAIVFDAFVVRMVLIPALLYLMGERSWWLPAWLDKVLPDVDVEGEKLDRGPGYHAEDSDLDHELDELNDEQSHRV